VRRSDLDEFLEASSSRESAVPEAGEVDEGSITAWATFGAAVAEATAVLERTDRADLVVALQQLTEATAALVDSLRADEAHADV
jgi:hypothetical protein